MPRPDKFISQPEGYIEPNTSGSFDYVYQYKDHLGNVRLSYSDTNKDGFVSSPNGNIVFSDDLENSSGWDSEGAKYGWSVPIDTGKGHLDNYSVKLHRTVTGGFYAHSNEWISIDNSEPTTYKFSGWVYAQGSGYSWARLIFFMNEDTETDYFTEISSTSRVYTKNQWVYLEQEVTVPVNIDKINLRVGLYNNSPSVTAWFDELRIEKIEESEIVEENNYYPFGLEHKGYNNVVNGTENNYKTFQGQEINKELGLNWISFKYRNYDPAIGRFFNVDPLAQEYAYQSPYNFSENRVIDGVELEGAERLSIHSPGWGGNNGSPIRNEHPTEVQMNVATAGVVARHPIASSNVGKWERGGKNISTVSSRIAIHAAENGNMSTGSGSQRNALRHATWIATIASNYGEGVAQRI